LCSAQFWVAKDKKIFDPKGNEFLIRGINSANADWDSFGRYYARNSFASIASTGANLVRVVWRSNVMNENDLKNVIEEAKKNKLVCMIELHDTTGSPDEYELEKAGKWWKDRIWNLLKYYKEYVIINVGNEWSPWGTPYDKWCRAYKKAIEIIRSVGWEGALVIDASAYAQNPDSILAYGNELLNSDPKKNLIFSLHMYAEWRNEAGGRKIGDNLYNIQQKGLTVIVGEFTLHHPDGCKWIKVDVWELMRQCKWKNVGYIAWSWHGNGKGDCNYDLANPSSSLNMVKGSADDASTWTRSDFTEFGNAVVWYQEFGIKATSKRATIF